MRAPDVVARVGVLVVGETAPWREVTWDWEAVSTDDSEGEPGARPPLEWMGLLSGEPLASAAARDLIRSLLGGWGESDLLTFFERVAWDIVREDGGSKKVVKIDRRGVKPCDWR